MSKRMISALSVFGASIALLFVGLTLPGCNTMEGAGEDIGEAGESIEDAAD